MKLYQYTVLRDMLPAREEEVEALKQVIRRSSLSEYQWIVRALERLHLRLEASIAHDKRALEKTDIDQDLKEKP